MTSGSYPASDTSELCGSVPADKVRMKHPKYSIGPEWEVVWGMGGELSAAADLPEPSVWSTS